MKRNKLSVFILLVFALIFASGCSLIPTSSAQYGTSPTETEARARQIAKNNVNAVVSVVIENSLGSQISLGSGVGIYSGGYIATNYHVIQNTLTTTSLTIKIYQNNSEQAYNAEVLWHSEPLDLAILKSEGENLPFVKMQDRFIYASNSERLQVLETVIAIGTPLDMSLQNTITLGYIASTNYRISTTTDGSLYEHLIQHTAPINHGNSGGALFDINGKLIGLNTLGIDDANSLFFAVPIYPITAIIEKVVAGYNIGVPYAIARLGITAADRYQSSLINEKGMYVDSVSETSYVYDVLFEGDVIVEITTQNKTFDIDVRNDLIYALLNSESESTISAKVKRDGNIINLSLNLMWG